VAERDHHTPACKQEGWDPCQVIPKNAASMPQHGNRQLNSRSLDLKTLPKHGFALRAILSLIYVSLE